MSKPVSLGLIPARGGSKRLPRKNILDFAGKPMLAWTVEEAFKSGRFTDIAVSTDDDEVAEVARASGAQVLRRSLELSHDDAGLIGVIQDALRRWPSPVGEVCLLLGNCPVRTAEDIQAGHERFVETGAPAMLSVTSFCWTPPFRALAMQNGRIEGIFSEWIHKNSQQYPSAVCPTGAVYWAKPDAMLAGADLYIDGIQGFMMPWHRSIDIDTREDFELALCVRYALDRGFKFGA